MKIGPPVINLPLKCGFLNFPSFPSFRFGSIAYSSERKPGNAGNFGIFENFEFCLSSSQTLDPYMTYK